MGFFQRAGGVFPFKVRIKEKGGGCHRFECVGRWKDGVAKGLQESLVKAIECWVLHVDLFDLVSFPCILVNDLMICLQRGSIPYVEFPGLRPA